jgi:tetratricopeptide (TPR) repeat protein
MHLYNERELKRLFGLPVPIIRTLRRAGQIQPLGAGDRARYSFQDLLVLRMASALSAAKTPVEKMMIALENIRAFMPGATLHARSAARRGGDGGARPVDGSVGVFHVRSSAKHPARRAERHFERALVLEEKDPDAAQAAYRKSLTLDAHHVEARINLGRLLHLSGKHVAAEEVYRAGLTANALLSYNLALLLEDLDRESEAILAYRDALAHDPRMADAHFNLARLHEKAGNPQDAFRHLLAHRRLSPPTSF